jgi:hypothetical protein
MNTKYPPQNPSTPAVPPAPTMFAIPPDAGDATAGGGAGATTPRPTLSNLSNKVPLSLKEVRQYLQHLTHGWPKVASDLLCYRRKDLKTGRRTPVYLEDAADLFAWMDDYCHVAWYRSAGCSTKEEFLRHLLQKCKRYDWATDLPHFPPLPGVLYTNPAPAPANTGRLDEFVKLFSLQSEADRKLVKAFTMTPFWGGPPGKRPLFVFGAVELTADPNAGRGAGKSTIAQAVGRLSGGYLSLQKEGEKDRVVSDLLSPAGLNVRVVILDNVKSLKFSDQFLEALITDHQIDGHRLYQGHGHRPNLLTYVMTANELMLSKDLTTRSVLIWVRQSKKSPAWDTKLHTMLNDPVFLEELHADIAWHFERPMKGPEGEPDEGAGETAYDRWAPWWREVASRVCNDDAEFEALRATVEGRRPAVDGDLSEREAVEEALAGVMAAAGIHDLDNVAVFVPSRILPRAIPDLFGRQVSSIQVSRRVKQLKLPTLHHTRQGPPAGKTSGFWWVGSEWLANYPCRAVHALGEDLAGAGRYRREDVAGRYLVQSVLQALGKQAAGDVAGSGEVG